MADMLVATLRALLSLDNTGYLAGLEDSHNKAAEFASNMSKVGGAVVGAVVTAAGAAIAGGVVLMKGAIEEALAADQINAKLNSTLANTGQITGVTAGMVNDLATNFSGLTRYEDDSIAAGGEVLARFKEINADVFPESLQLTLDLAERLGIDVPEAAALLGKALAVPGEGLKKLKEAGVVLDDQQQKQIETMMNMGDTAGAQQVLLDALNGAVGGAAVAAGATAAGTWDRLHNIWTNVQETLGTGLLPVISALGASLANDLNKPEVQAFIQNLATGIADFATKVYMYIPTIVSSFWSFVDFFTQNQGIVVGILAALGVAAMAWGITTAIAAWTAMAPFLPVIAVLVLIAAAAYLLYEAWTTNFGGIQEKLAAVWAAVQPVLQMLWGWLQVNIPLALQALANFWQNVLLPALLNVWSWMQSTLFPFLTTLADFIGAVLGKAVEALAGLWQNVLQPALETIWAFIQDNLFPLLQALGGWLSEKLAPAFDSISAAIGTATAWLGTMADKIRNLKLPDWLTPGSPTPWELGLLGIGDALQSLSNSDLPSFDAALQLHADPFAANGAVDLQPRAAGVATETGGGRGAVSSEALMQEMRNMLADLPNTIARANRVTLEKVTVSRSQ
jgi:hypothetical protein